MSNAMRFVIAIVLAHASGLRADRICRQAAEDAKTDAKDLFGDRRDRLMFGDDQPAPTPPSGDQTPPSGDQTPPSGDQTPPADEPRRIVEPAKPPPKPPVVETVITKPANPDDDGEPKLSLPTQADRQAWLRSGFRLGLGLTYGDFVGLRGAPSGRLFGALVRFGIRLDDSWSLLASFEYARVSKPMGLSGLRFAGTLDPTWHATRSLSVALGFGFGGIVEGRTGRPDVDPLPGSLDTSYTFPSARTPLPSCSGVGVAGLVRGEWSYVIGPRAETTLALEVDGQWTGCVDDTNRVEPDTGLAIVRRQYWPHAGVAFSWIVMWR